MKIEELNAQAAKLPFGMPEFTPLAGSPVPTSEKALSPEAKAMLTAWKPMLDKVDWANEVAGAPAYRKAYELSAKLVVSQMLTNMARLRPSVWHREATLATTDIPALAKQWMATILRAYPRLFAIQLFGVVPFTGPDGRVFFRTAKYNSTYSSTVPNIADGDGTHDLTKFNTGFFQIDQGGTANKMKLSITSLIIAVASYRVVSDWTYEGADDFASQFGGDLNAALVGEMSNMLQWVTDRVMVAAALAAAPAANNGTWTAQPAGYANLAPSEKKAYDETLWSDGILPVITKISKARAYNIMPNWAIADPTAAERLMKLTTFVPLGGPYTDSIDLGYGALRDIGTLRQLGIRVLVDPQMTANTILFGRKPTAEFDPCISFCPYQPIRMTGQVDDPDTGTYTKGVYSRFGVADPDTGTNADSSQLADVYGKLTIS